MKRLYKLATAYEAGKLEGARAERKRLEAEIRPHITEISATIDSVTLTAKLPLKTFINVTTGLK